MILTNNQILEYYNNLKDVFNDNNKYFPAKITFCIRKNINILKAYAEEIYSARDNIIMHYGAPDENEKGTFIILPENRAVVQQELDELLELEQDIKLLVLNLKALEDIEFTSNQMEALMFMIDDSDDQVE